MPSPLENLSGPGKSLQKEPPDAKEFAGLKRSGLARLADAANTTNSLRGRFDLAYNAAHALCLAALRCHGYRPTNRYIIFQVLPHTLGLGPEVWRVLGMWLSLFPHRCPNRSASSRSWRGSQQKPNALNPSTSANSPSWTR